MCFPSPLPCANIFPKPLFNLGCFFASWQSRRQISFLHYSAGIDGAGVNPERATSMPPDFLDKLICSMRACKVYCSMTYVCKWKRTYSCTVESRDVCAQVQDPTPPHPIINVASSRWACCSVASSRWALLQRSIKSMKTSAQNIFTRPTQPSPPHPKRTKKHQKTKPTFGFQPGGSNIYVRYVTDKWHTWVEVWNKIAVIQNPKLSLSLSHYVYIAL